MIARIPTCIRGLVFSSLLAVALPMGVSIADGVAPSATPNQASDASFDKRLPPVLPGERVSDDGHTMRVWSTTGPVPVSSAPAAPSAGESVDLGGVIVDERGAAER